MLNTKKGFTLIELLVVIAIIGILSSVVLSSLSTARTKAKDASAIASLQQARAGAEIWADSNSQKYNTAGTAVTACTSVATNMFETGAVGSVQSAIVAAQNANAKTALCGITATGDAYAIALPLAAGATNEKYCIDSTGVAKKTTGTFAAGTTVCP